jgi:hypothetical protein
MPNDQWDLGWVFERQIVELEVNGAIRKVIVTAGKMALYDALDAETGEYIDSFNVGIQNIIIAIDPKTGDKTINPIVIPNAEEANLLCPMANGGRNWPSALRLNRDHSQTVMENLAGYRRSIYKPGSWLGTSAKSCRQHQPPYLLAED